MKSSKSLAVVLCAGKFTYSQSWIYEWQSIHKTVTNNSTSNNNENINEEVVNVAYNLFKTSTVDAETTCKSDVSGICFCV